MSTAAGTEAAAGAAAGTGTEDQGKGSEGGGGTSEARARDLGGDAKDRELARAREDAERYKRERDADRAKLTEAERAKMDDKQRAESERDEWKGKASAAEVSALKLQVALEAAPDGMSAKRVAQLAKRISGSTREELEKDAKDLFAEFGNGSGDGKEGDGKGGDAQVPRRPNSRLRGGANNDEEDEDGADVDLDKVPRY